MTILKAKPRAERKRNRIRTTEEQKNDIVRMYNSDEKIDDICKAFNISRSTVYRVIRERSK